MYFQKNEKQFFKSHGIEEYLIDKDSEPFEQQSSTMRKTKFGKMKQNGDMWFETFFHNYTNSKTRIFFASHKRER